MMENETTEVHLQESVESPGNVASASECPIVDWQIETVQGGTMEYLKRHLDYAMYVALGVIVFYGILVLFHVPLSGLYVIPMFILVAGYAYVRKQVLREFMRQFAAANGFSYAEDGTVDGRNGTLFTIGHSKSVSNVVSGTYKQCSMELFDYRYTIGSGKNSHTYPFTVFELRFDIAMPNIMLENRECPTGAESIFGGFPGLETIRLEGDFSDRFTLGVRRDYEIEALQIFTPDVMAVLMDKGRNFSMEIVEGQLFLYAKNTIETRQALAQFFDLARYFAEKLVPRFARMKSGIAAMNESFGMEA
jgi:hypothetical protein